MRINKGFIFVMIIGVFSCNHRSYPDMVINEPEHDKTFDILNVPYYKKQVSIDELDLTTLKNTTLGTIINGENKQALVYKTTKEDPYLQHIRQSSKSLQVFYYGILDTIDYYKIVYFTQGDYGKSFDLAIYDKANKLIESQEIAYIGGDENIYYTETKALNDTFYIKINVEGEYTYDNSQHNYENVANGIKILKKDSLCLSLQRDGKFKVDTL